MFILFILSLAHATQPFDCDKLLAQYVSRPQPAAALTPLIAGRYLGQSWPTVLERRHQSVLNLELAKDPDLDLVGSFTKPFAARILVNPDVEGRSRVFAMFLAPAEVDQSGAQSIRETSSVPDALGHLRFDRSGRDFIVTTTAGDGFDSLSLERKLRFRSWSEQILIAFERYAAQVSGNEPCRIILRAPIAVESLRRAALSLGYHSVAERHLNGLAITSHQFVSSVRKQRTDAAREMSFVRRDRLAQARADVNQRITKTAPRAPYTGSLDGEVALTPLTLLPAELVYQSNDQWRAHGHILAQLPAWTARLSGRSLVSLGRRLKREQTAPPLIEGFTVDLPRAVSRPAIVSSADQPGSLLIEGVGRRGIRDVESIFSVNEDRSVDGGLLESIGVAEFRRHLELTALSERAGLEIAVAQPVAVGWPEFWPVNSGEHRSMVPWAEFVKAHVPDSKEILVHAIYFVRSAARLSAVRMATESQLQTELLNKLLAQAYSAHDQPLDIPSDATNGDPDETTKGYLRYIHAKNRDAGDQILRTWTERSLATIGLLHGLGFKLGKTLDSHNVSVAGELIKLADLRPGGLSDDPAYASDLDRWVSLHRTISKLVIGSVQKDPVDWHSRDSGPGQIYHEALAKGAALVRD